MIIYGYVKGHKYQGDGTLMLQVRVPNIHGPYTESGYRGRQVRNYTRDADLPWYQSLLLPHLPHEGDVVALLSTHSGNDSFLVIGLTGGSYQAGSTNIGG